jgi:hypothetical protein
MNCAEIIPKLELMADDELTSEQAAQTLSHIDDCTSCRDNWYGILALRQAIKDRAASFNPPEDFEDSLIHSIRKEAWQSRAGQRRNSWLIYAACLVVAGVASAYFYIAWLEENNHPDRATIATNPETSAPSPQSGVKNQQQSASTIATGADLSATNFSSTNPPASNPSASNPAASNPSASGPSKSNSSPTYAAASLEDAMINFKQYLEKPARLGGAPISFGNLSALSNKAGFVIKPMQLAGFKLAGADLVTTAPGKTKMVRLCYTRITDKGTSNTTGNGGGNRTDNGGGNRTDNGKVKGIGMERDSIICYQTASGQLVAKGLNEHLIDGKKVCCGEVGDKSVVFIPGQKGNPNEVLLVGTISKSDLMDLVLSSS